jgi:hypothetical protein
MKRIEATAHHEAGHAACNLILGRGFEYVTIVEDEDSYGHCKGVIYRGGQRLAEDVYGGNSRARNWIERRAKVFLAGNVAEERFTGRKVVTGSHNDFHNAVEMLDHLCGDTDELEAYINLLFIQTRNLLTAPFNWLIVERLAAELLDKQTVRYKAAKKVADQARNDYDRLPTAEMKRMWEEVALYRQQRTKRRTK